MNNLSYLFLPQTLSKTDNEQGFNCLMLSIRDVFSGKTPDQILYAVQQEPKYSGFSHFFDIFDSTLKLGELYKDVQIRKEFHLKKPDFSSLYELGTLSLLNAMEDIYVVKFGYKGAKAKSKKYARIRAFVEERYEMLAQKNPDIKTSVAAYKISQMIMNEQIDCPIVPSNLAKCVSVWVAKIKNRNTVR